MKSLLSILSQYAPMMLLSFSNNAWSQTSAQPHLGPRLSLEVTGPLSLEERRAVSRLVDPTALESYLTLNSVKAKSGDRLCSDCLSIKGKSDKELISVVESGITFNKKPYAIIDPNAPSGETLLENSFDKNWNSVALALDVMAVNDALKDDTLQELFLRIDGTKQYAFDSITSPKIARLNDRVQKFGYFTETIEPLDSPATRKALKALQLSPNVSFKGPLPPPYPQDVSWLSNTVTKLEPQQLCQSKAVNDALTLAEDEDWPFNVKVISGRLKDHEATMKALNLRLLPPTKILIIDSGLGQKVYDKHFFNLIASNHSDALFPSDYVTKNKGDDSKTQCRYTEDLPTDGFGHGFSPKIGLYECRKNRRDRIHPIDGRSEFEYSPDHGTYVGLLSAGGPDFIQQYPEISGRIKLDFAKITKSSSSGFVSTDVNDLIDAIAYGHTVDADILNLSLKVKDTNNFKYLSKNLHKFEGLVTAAAGNTPEVLDTQRGVFPAGIPAGIRSDKRLIVVGATKKSGDTISLWEKSTFSKVNVDIAAPGARIRSTDRHGNAICSDGTSSAAPLVAFTAAMIRGTGLTNPVELRRRILATADYNNNLVGKVVDGRVLNIDRALDLFVDHLWLTNNPNHSKRGYFLRFAENLSPEHLRQFDGGAYILCKPRVWDGSRPPEQIDLNNLQQWQRNSENGLLADFWTRTSGHNNRLRCYLDENTKLRFYNLETNQVERVQLDSVERIVPSPYRAAIKELYIKTLEESSE